MSYQVLARKWRPRSFAELMGQTHVVRALSHALDAGRVHHAFLFTGTRGIGKTTIARILARCLNCEQGVSATPCGECGTCREIDEGRFPDLIEVDAASRAKVDETRELMENVQFAPTRGRYKVYLIDEVHMFSNHSFNALLKTLEEPPPHVKFLLATTDPQKLPVTVLSRCLQFNLKRLPRDQIATQLTKILQAEGIEFDNAAVAAIASAADGSMRDALSLVDQAVGFGGGKLLGEDTRAMLGTVERGHVFAILDALAAGSGADVLAVVARLDEQAPDYDEALAGMLSALQRIAVLQLVPGSAAGDDFAEDDEQQALNDLAARLAAEDVQLYYQIGLLGRRDLVHAPDPRAGFEMILLRMLAFRPAGAPAPVGSGDGRRERAPMRAPPARGAVPAVPAPKPARNSDRVPPPAAERDAGPVSATPAPSAPSAPTVSSLPALEPSNWEAVVAALGLSGLSRQLAAHCTLQAADAGSVRLQISPGHEPLMANGPRRKLENALKQAYGETLTLRIDVAEPDSETPAMREARRREQRQAAAVQAIENDPQVRALCDTFDTRVEAGNVRVLGDDGNGRERT